MTTTPSTKAIFDSAGNLITKRPKKPKQPKQEAYEILKNELGLSENQLNELDKKMICQYCKSKWDSKASKNQHESWCKKNPNKREYRKKTSKKAEKAGKKDIIIDIDIERDYILTNPIIKELREFDKVFGLTDEQIVKYIRDKIG